MLALLSTLPEPQNDNKKPASRDLLGLGQATQAISDSFGKLLSNIPIHKFSPGMAFVAFFYVILWGVEVYLINSDNPAIAQLNHKAIIYSLMIFGGVVASLFTFVEIRKMLLSGVRKVNSRSSAKSHSRRS